MLINLGVRNAGVFGVATVANAMECWVQGDGGGMNERGEQTGIIYGLNTQKVIQYVQQTTHHIHIEIAGGGGKMCDLWAPIVSSYPHTQTPRHYTNKKKNGIRNASLYERPGTIVPLRQSELTSTPNRDPIQHWCWSDSHRAILEIEILRANLRVYHLVYHLSRIMGQVCMNITHFRPKLGHAFEFSPRNSGL